MKIRTLFLAAVLVAAAVCPYAAVPGKWYAVTVGGKGIIVPDGSMEDGTPVEIWTQTDVPSQLWHCLKGKGKTVVLQSGWRGNCLCRTEAARAGAPVVARAVCGSDSCAEWVLIPVKGNGNAFRIATPDGKYVVKAVSADDRARLVLADGASAHTVLAEWEFAEHAGHVSTCFDENARDALADNFFGQYCHSTPAGLVLGAGGWWGDAEMFETILDAFETTGNKKYQTYFAQLAADFFSRNGIRWDYNLYNDDITWMVLACARGYKYFNVGAWLEYARQNFDLMYERALQPRGALRWNQEPKNWYGSNSCINGPAAVAACYLYELTGDRAYLEKARSIYAFQRSALFDAATGQVYDSGHWNSGWTDFSVGNRWASTYNQGTMLGAATKLYLLTGEEQYASDARKVWNYTYANMCNRHKILHACQVATGDLCGFKGILMRYVRLYGQTFGDGDVFGWMEKNAWFACQNANSRGIVWSRWLTKTPENFVWNDNGREKDFSNDAFGASTAVSAAFNAHINRRFCKDAFSIVGAGHFDDIQFMQLAPVGSDGATPNTTPADSGYICFRNVDFGSKGATRASLRLYSARQGGNYTLYADKISSETKMGTVNGLETGWNTYRIKTAKTAGMHTLYAVPSGSGGSMFHWVVFAGPKRF